MPKIALFSNFFNLYPLINRARIGEVPFFYFRTDPKWVFGPKMNSCNRWELVEIKMLIVFHSGLLQRKWVAIDKYVIEKFQNIWTIPIYLNHFKFFCSLGRSTSVGRNPDLDPPGKGYSPYISGFRYYLDGTPHK